MTQINELYPPEIAEEILKGQKILRRNEVWELQTKMLIERKKKEKDAAYRKIILDRVPEQIHKFVTPFTYRFIGDPNKPEPSDVFDVEIPGLLRFSFQFNPELTYLLPEVNLACWNGLDDRKTRCNDDLPLVLAKLVEIKRELDYKLHGKSDNGNPIYYSQDLVDDGNTIEKDIEESFNKSSDSVCYEPFDDDGPNADPDVDEENLVSVKLPEQGNVFSHLIIPAGSFVTSMEDLKKLVFEIANKLIGNEIASHIANFHLK